MACTGGCWQQCASSCKGDTSQQSSCPNCGLDMREQTCTNYNEHCTDYSCINCGYDPSCYGTLKQEDVGCGACSDNCGNSCSTLCNNGCSGNADANAYNRLKDKRLEDYSYIDNQDFDDLASILTQCYKCMQKAQDSEYPKNKIWGNIEDYASIEASFINSLVSYLRAIKNDVSQDEVSQYNIIPLSYCQNLINNVVSVYDIKFNVN